MNPTPSIPLRVAVVKSSIYQDLWVCNRSKDPVEVFKTTLMRTSPIGFCEIFEDVEFLIVKDVDEYPTRICCLPNPYPNELKYSTKNKIPGLPFLDETFHKNVSQDSVAHSVDSVDWSQYQIVIAINACIPSRVTSQYPRTLWCYYVGENEDHLVYNRFQDYDLVLNQDVTKSGMPCWMIGFSYSFVGAFTMEKLAGELGVGLKEGEVKTGVFMEINNTTDRPVTKIPWEFSKIAEETDHQIVLHDQNILENLGRVSKSKYFVKLMGIRRIRGNGLLETISAGTLILANKNFVTLHELVLDECHVETPEDVIAKIRWFDANPEDYSRAIMLQRSILHEKFYKEPVENLVRLYSEKIQKS